MLFVSALAASYALYATVFWRALLAGAARRNGLVLSADAVTAVIPGRVRLEGVELRAGDGRFVLVTPRAELEVALSSLLSPVLHVHSLRLDDVELHLRRRDLPPEATPSSSPAGVYGWMPAVLALDRPEVRIDRVTAELRRLDALGYHLRGRIALALKRVEVRGGRGKVPVSFEFRGVELRRRDGEVSGVLEGRGSIELGPTPPDALLGAPFGVRSGHVSMRGIQVRGLEQLLPLDGRPELGDGVKVEATLSRPNVGKVDVTAPRFEQRGEGWTLTAAEPTLGFVMDPGDDSRPLSGRVSLRSRELTLVEGPRAMTFELEGLLAVVMFGPAGLELGEGLLRADALRFTGPSGVRRAQARVAVELEGAHFALGRLRTSGAMRVTGADGGLLVDLAALPEPMRLAFASVVGEPFTLDARFEREPGRWALDTLRASSTNLTVEGAFIWTRGQSQAALLVTRGRIRLGLALDGDASRVELGATRQWLERELARLTPD